MPYFDNPRRKKQRSASRDRSQGRDGVRQQERSTSRGQYGNNDRRRGRDDPQIAIVASRRFSQPAFFFELVSGKRRWTRGTFCSEAGIGVRSVGGGGTGAKPRMGCL